MAILRFHQIYPHQPLPVMAKDFKVDIPRRAELFCHPFKEVLQQGCYFFSPLNFSFRCNQDSLQIRVPGLHSDKDFELTFNRDKATETGYVALHQYAPEQSENCLAQYRQRIPAEELPEHIPLNDFGFYEIMINVFAEEDPYGFFLQVWLGGVLETEVDSPQLLIKSATNVNMNSGFTCLDAVIDAHQWQGWMAVVIQATEHDKWVHIKQDMPLCQGLILDEKMNNCETVLFNNVEQSKFLEPLRWHLFDEKYGRKQGKYQRQIKNHKQ